MIEYDEFICVMCHNYRFIKDFAFSVEIEGIDEGVCGWCAGCYE